MLFIIWCNSGHMFVICYIHTFYNSDVYFKTVYLFWKLLFTGNVWSYNNLIMEWLFFSFPILFVMIIICSYICFKRCPESEVYHLILQRIQILLICFYPQATLQTTEFLEMLAATANPPQIPWKRMYHIDDDKTKSIDVFIKNVL